MSGEKVNTIPAVKYAAVGTGRLAMIYGGAGVLCVRRAQLYNRDIHGHLQPIMQIQGMLFILRLQ